MALLIIELNLEVWSDVRADLMSECEQTGRGFDLCFDRSQADFS